MESETQKVARRPLIGTEEANLDEKGRLLFSRQKRERLGETFAISVCEKGCLAAYSLEVWDQMWDQLNSYSPLDLTPRRYAELLFANADDEVKFDPQGRCVINSRLRVVGRLTKQVRIIGDGNRAELWDPVEYGKYLQDRAQYEQQRREDFERAAMQVTDIWSRR